MNNNLTFLQLIKFFDYRITLTEKEEDHPVYGTNLKLVQFDGSWAVVNASTDTVMEINVLTTEGTVFWVDEKYEVAMHSHTKNKGHQCFSQQSTLKIALAIEQKQEYDKGLVNDISFNLDNDTIVKLQQLADDRGITFDMFLTEAIDEMCRSIIANNTEAKTPTEV